MQPQVKFHNKTKIRIMVQIFAGRDSVSTAFVNASASETLSAESLPYDVYCKDVVSGGELGHLLDSSDSSITLQVDNGHYLIKGEKQSA